MTTTPPQSKTPNRVARWALLLSRCIASMVTVAYWTWAIGAACHFTVAPKSVRIILIVATVAVPLVCLSRTRRFRFLLISMAGVIGVMALCWQFQLPSNERNWKPELVNAPTAEIGSDRVEITNYMAYEGQTTQSFDLSKMKGLWFGVQKFADFGSGAHNFLSFEFSDGKFVTISVEARKEIGEEFALLPALFRQFELTYLIGDEAQVFAARSDFEAPTYLYPLKSSPAKCAGLFVDMCNRANELAANPEWYNILTNNCTNNLAWHASRVAPRSISSYDVRVVMSGHAAQLLYAMGLLDVEGDQLLEIEEDWRIDAVGREIVIDSQFPLRIREFLPRG